MLKKKLLNQKKKNILNMAIWMACYHVTVQRKNIFQNTLKHSICTLLPVFIGHHDIYIFEAIMCVL